MSVFSEGNFTKESAKLHALSREKKFTHDNLADTLLALTQTKSSIYCPEQDLLRKMRKLD